MFQSYATTMRFYVYLTHNDISFNLYYLYDVIVVCLD